MNQIEFRQVTRADYAQLETLIRKTWGSKTSYPAPIERALRKINLYHYLSEQNYNCIAIRQGEVVGVIFGRSEHLPYLPGKLKYLAPLLWNKAKLFAYPNGRAHFAQQLGRIPAPIGRCCAPQKRSSTASWCCSSQTPAYSGMALQRAAAALLSVHAAKWLPKHLPFYGYQLQLWLLPEEGLPPRCGAMRLLSERKWAQKGKPLSLY